jgi:23S rRNA pseudouridine2605 synthase
MQLITSGIESLSRRIALSGLMSRAQAESAILSGASVTVNGRFVSAGCKVPDSAIVVVNGIEIPPPPIEPYLWALNKPRGVISSFGKSTSTTTFLTDLLHGWNERDTSQMGTKSLEKHEQCNHYLVVNRIPTMATGLVLLATDSIFAKTLIQTDSKILTTYRVRLPPVSDTSIEEMRKWKQAVSVGGVSYGPVFVDVEKRTPTQTWLKVRYVETFKPNSSVANLMWFKAGLRVNRVNIYAFGPYVATDIPERTVLRIPIHDSIRHLVPKREIKPSLVSH